MVWSGVFQGYVTVSSEVPGRVNHPVCELTSFWEMGDCNSS